jgi:hypothetical protein
LPESGCANTALQRNPGRRLADRAHGLGNLSGNLIPYSNGSRNLRIVKDIAKSVRLPTTQDGRPSPGGCNAIQPVL